MPYAADSVRMSQASLRSRPGSIASGSVQNDALAQQNQEVLQVCDGPSS